METFKKDELQRSLITIERLLTNQLVLDKWSYLTGIYRLFVNQLTLLIKDKRTVKKDHENFITFTYIEPSERELSIGLYSDNDWLIFSMGIKQPKYNHQDIQDGLTDPIKGSFFVMILPNDTYCISTKRLD